MALAPYDHLMKAGPAKVDMDNPPKDQGDISGWKHISKLHTCQHCDKIVITHHQLKHLLVSLPQTKSEALQAEADGCPVFRMLNGRWHLIAYHHWPGDLLKLLRLLSSNKARLNKVAMLLWKPKFILDNLRRRHFHLLLSNERINFVYGTTRIECDGKLEILEGREEAIDAEGDLSGCVMDRKVNTGRVFAHLKAFISSCESSHESCQIPPTDFVPSRLLEVNSDSGPDHIRLVETAPGRQWTWACLSYVWGGDQRHKTTRSLLPQYLKDICLESLPRTIKDAVSVSRELGIAYLWVDSFCIVQDDELDKAREIPQMAFIYRHALLTIAAASAHGVEEGFLHHVRPICYRRFAPTSLRFRDGRGRESKPFVLTERHDTAVFHEPNEPIDSRAWALQEQLLSPRRLSYSSHGPVWSCRSLLQQVNAQPDRVSGPRCIEEYQWLSHNDVVPCIPGLDMLSWRSIVQLYSPRQATLRSDKLVALSAVAQTYSENLRQKDTYLAGIWENTMPLGLLWYVPGEDLRPRPPEQTAPSWSWASVGGAVRYDDDERDLPIDEDERDLPIDDDERDLQIDGDCEIISAQMRTVNSNKFGAVLGGELIVDAKVRECRVQHDAHYTYPSVWSYVSVDDGPQIKFIADTLEFGTSLRNEDIDVTLLIVSHDGRGRRSGLVLVRKTNSGSFTRVSLFLVEYEWDTIESRREYEEFFEGFENKRVTIV